MTSRTDQPTPEAIEELIAFLPIFSLDGFEPILRWDGGEVLPDGALTFPFPIYREEVEEFFRLAGQPHWADYDYAGKDLSVFLKDLDQVGKASLDQVKTLITYCVRGERFCDGHWGEVIESGLVPRLLERLAAFLTGIPGEDLFQL